MRKIDTNDRITVAVHSIKLAPSHAAAAGTKFITRSWPVMVLNIGCCRRAVMPDSPPTPKGMAYVTGCSGKAALAALAKNVRAKVVANTDPKSEISFFAIFRRSAAAYYRKSCYAL